MELFVALFIAAILALMLVLLAMIAGDVKKVLMLQQQTPSPQSAPQDTPPEIAHGH